MPYDITAIEPYKPSHKITDAIAATLKASLTDTFMDESHNFTTYASKFLSSRILGASSGQSPIFHANYDERSSNHGPWMNDDEIEQEMAHLQQSTFNRSSTSASRSRSPSPHEHLNKSAGSQRSGVSTPDINHINQAQSLFTNQSKLSFHKPPTPEPEPQEQIELQLSQPLLNQSHGDHNEDEEEDEQTPQHIFIQNPAPTPTAPLLSSTPIRKYRDAPFVVTYGFSIISVIIIGLLTLFSSNNVGDCFCLRLHQSNVTSRIPRYRHRMQHHSSRQPFYTRPLYLLH